MLPQIQSFTRTNRRAAARQQACYSPICEKLAVWAPFDLVVLVECQTAALTQNKAPQKVQSPPVGGDGEGCGRLSGKRGEPESGVS